MSRTILVPLDASDTSIRALPLARTIARLWRARLVLVHATRQPAATSMARVAGGNDLAALARELRKEAIEGEAITSQAAPASAIVTIARERRADLIVMASHQRRGLDHWLHGSVTEQVLAHALVPLLVVPAQGAPVPAPRQRVRILVPLDGSPLGDAVLNFLTEAATGWPLEILLLQVVRLAGNVGFAAACGLMPLVPVDVIEATRNQAHSYMAERVRVLQACGVSAQAQVIETVEPVASLILATAEREGVDAIALGTHGKGGLTRFALGSVSEDVLEHAPIPVLLVPPARRAAHLRNRGAPDLVATHACRGAPLAERRQARQG